MTTELINCIRGYALQITLSHHDSLNSLKNFINLKWRIPTQDIFIITPYGVKLKAEDFQNKQNLQLFNVLYVFHRKIFSNVMKPVLAETSPKVSNAGNGAEHTDNKSLNSANPIDESAHTGSVESMINILLNEIDPLPIILKPMPSPFQDFPLDKKSNVSQLKSFLKTNLGWLKALEIDVNFHYKQINDVIGFQNVYVQSVEIIINYLQLYCDQIHSLYSENNTSEQNKLLIETEIGTRWKESYSFLTNLECVISHKNFKSLAEYFDYSRLNNEFIELQENQRELFQYCAYIEENLANLRNYQNVLIENSNSLKKTLSDMFSVDMTLEKNLFQNFGDYVEQIHNITTELLVDRTAANDSAAHPESDSLSRLAKILIPKITIISMSIFSKANEILVTKRNAQHKIIKYLGEITYVQINALNLKKKIVNELEAKVQNVSKSLTLFDQLNNFPILYGIFLIELLRRKKWVSQILEFSNTHNTGLFALQKDELQNRNEWIRNFQKLNEHDTRDSSALNMLLNTENKDCEVVTDIINECNFQFSSVRNCYAITEHMLLEYFNQLINLGLSKDLVDELLLGGLEELNSYGITLPTTKEVSNHIDNKTESAEVLASYKSRIQILETQLLTKNIHSTGKWPNGLFSTSVHLNTDFFSNNEKVRHQPFDDLLNSTMVSTTLTSNRPDQREQLMLQKLNTLQRENQMLRTQNQKLVQELHFSNTELNDLRTENGAYKEAAVMSNNAIVSMSNEIESFQNAELELSNKFKQDLRILLNQNNRNFHDFDDLLSKFNNLNISKSDLQKTLETSQKKFLSERSRLSDEIQNLKGEVDQLKQLELTKQDSDEKYVKIVELFNQYINELFNIVINDIFVLENIGLLLERERIDDKEVLKINRVKGLRKKIDETTVLSLESPTLEMNSSLVNDLKEMKASFNLNSGSSSAKYHFLQFIQNLYNDELKLYETSVVKRFKDVEQLAKKLTKENKKVKTHFNKNGIVVGDLAIGDLALFLPAKLDSDFIGDFSSVSSSMSSIDLATPPPLPQAPSMSQSLSQIEASSERPVTAAAAVLNPHATPASKNMNVWTAFTAFGNTRYIIKDFVPIRGEWFIAEISSLEKHVASSTENPYNLDIGLVWYAITVKPVQRR